MLHKLAYWYCKLTDEYNRRLLPYLKGPQAARAFQELDDGQQPPVDLPPRFLDQAARALRQADKNSAAVRATQAAIARYLCRGEVADARTHLWQLQRWGQSGVRTQWLKLACSIASDQERKVRLRLKKIANKEWLDAWGASIVQQVGARQDRLDATIRSRISRLKIESERKRRYHRQKSTRTAQDGQTASGGSSSKSLSPEEALQRELEKMSGGEDQPVVTSL